MVAITRLLSRFFAVGAWISVLALAQPPVTTYETIETREYASDNGHRIRITSLGNLAGLEMPRGFEHIRGARSKEGYVLAYMPPGSPVVRVVRDLHDSYSQTISPGQRDLMPHSLEGMPSGTAFRYNALVTARAIVDTRDGLLRLTHEFTWRAGTGMVNIKTTVENRSSTSAVPLVSFKRHVDLDVDAYGPSGSGNPAADFDHGKGPLYGFGVRCWPTVCPPPCPEGSSDPECFRSAYLHTIAVSGMPTPTHRLIKAASDDSELYSPGAILPDLPGQRFGENDQLTLVWSFGAALPPRASVQYTAGYQLLGAR